jgi:dTDP-glucose pyrophosphorylase
MLSSRSQRISTSLYPGQRFYWQFASLFDFGRQHILWPRLTEVLGRAAKLRSGGLIFGYQVTDPQHYGVIEFNPQGRAISIEENR